VLFWGQPAASRLHLDEEGAAAWRDDRNAGDHAGPFHARGFGLRAKSAVGDRENENVRRDNASPLDDRRLNASFSVSVGAACALT
jgi:hypothetical protein